MRRSHWSFRLGLAVVALCATVAVATSPLGGRLGRMAASAWCCRTEMAVVQEFLQALAAGDTSRMALFTVDSMAMMEAQEMAARVPEVLVAAASTKAIWAGAVPSPGTGVVVFVRTPIRARQALCYSKGDGDEVQVLVLKEGGAPRVARVGLSPC